MKTPAPLSLKPELTLALNGGQMAVPEFQGVPQLKIGVAEFISIAERFGFSPPAIERVRNAISDEDLGNGPNLAHYVSASPKATKGEEFARVARERFAVSYALGTSSGTGALHSAMVAVGAGPGKEVIVPAIGFLATSMTVALAGATPVFCDVDESLQMDPTKLEALITPHTVAIAPTHYWSFVCDMDPIMEIARRCGVAVIEDCAQAPGATYKGRPVGSIGDIGCFSISAYKIIGGGEGGLVVTNDEKLFDRVRQTAEAGGLWRRSRFAAPRYAGELFVGSNYRMSELEAAVDVVQLQRLPGIVERHRVASRRLLGSIRPFREIRWQKSNDPQGDIGYGVYFYPETYELGQQITRALRAEGLSVDIREDLNYPDWHLYSEMLPLFEKHAERCAPDHCPVAVDLFTRRVGLRPSQWWTEADCDAVAEAVNKVFGAYCTAA